MTSQNLELKIPPLLVTLIFAFSMWLMAVWFPEAFIELSSNLIMVQIFFGVAVFFSLGGVFSFWKAKTSVNPTSQDGNTSLVTSGIYRLSRNPMYLGFLFLLIAWAFYWSNLFSLFVCPFFVLYLNRFQIRPEEKALKTLFGKQYIKYKMRTRRWL